VHTEIAKIIFLLRKTIIFCKNQKKIHKNFVKFFAKTFAKILAKTIAKFCENILPFFAKNKKKIFEKPKFCDNTIFIPVNVAPAHPPWVSSWQY